MNVSGQRLKFRAIINEIGKQDKHFKLSEHLSQCKDNPILNYITIHTDYGKHPFLNVFKIYVPESHCYSIAAITKIISGD